jgi:hypothetical protein
MTWTHRIGWLSQKRAGPRLSDTVRGRREKEQRGDLQWEVAAVRGCLL